MRLIDADRLLSDQMKSKYYHLPNGDTAIPIIDIEHYPTVGGWISVDERLPEKDQLVIAAVFGHDCIVLQGGETVEQAIERVQRECRYTTVAYIAEDGWTKYDGYPMIVHPSYWMPLPEPPKGVHDVHEKELDETRTGLYGKANTLSKMGFDESGYMLDFENPIRIEMALEPIAPCVAGNEREFENSGSWWYVCGDCHMPIDRGDKFCRNCGREVKWDEAD